jgi:hypothetical protein
MDSIVFKVLWFVPYYLVPYHYHDGYTWLVKKKIFLRKPTGERVCRNMGKIWR